MADPTRVKWVPVSDYGKPEEHIKRLSQAVNGLLDGTGNNHFLESLVANATETEVYAEKASIGSAVSLSPMSASAAASMAIGAVWAEARAEKIVIHHDSQPGTDRAFSVVLNG